MTRVLALVLLLAPVALVAPVAYAEELDAQAIVDKALAHNAFGFTDAVAQVTLDLRGADGAERSRQLEIRTLDQGGRQKTLVRFHAPADVAGTGFLVLEGENGETRQYLYLPALGKVKRITANQRNQRFMGTDLTYADLEWRSLEKANLVRLPDAMVGGNPVYVIEARPKNGEDSAYGKTITRIDRGSFVPLEVEFYDKDGSKLVKTLSVKRLERREGKLVATESLVKDLVAGSQTRMRITGLDTRAPLSERDFTEQALSGG